MPLDTSIYGQFAPAAKSVQDYQDEDLMRQARLQGLQQNQLAMLGQRQKLDEYNRNLADQQAYRNELAKLQPNATTADRIAAAQRVNNAYGYSQADAMQKAEIDRQKAQAESRASQAKTLEQLLKAQNQFATQVMANPTREAAMGALANMKALSQQLGINQDFSADEQAVSAFQTPEQIKQWAAGAALAAKDMLPKLQTINVGNAQINQAVNPLTGAVTDTARTATAQSPDNAATNARIAADAAAARAQAQQHFEANMAAPQYMQTDAGLVALPKKPAPGVMPTATVITGPNGESLGKPLKDIPAAVNTAIIGNAQNLARVNQALSLLNGENVGDLKGDKNATGWKGYAPQSILNRMDPAGVDTRAMIADLGSMVFHERSGAAVTAAESPRLRPFIPEATDDAATVKKKLTRFKQVYEQEQQALNDTYSKEQGYRPSPVKSGKPTGTASTPSVNAKGWTLHTDAAGNKAYVSPDGKQFEEVK